MSLGEQFLSNPSHLPETGDSDTWGDESVWLDIAGPVHFSGLTPTQVRTAVGRFGWSESDHVSATANVRICRMRESEFVLFQRHGWTYSLDFEYRPGYVRIVGYDFVGLITFGPVLEGTLWTCRDDDVEFATVFENFYRIFVAYQAIAEGGLLLHSAAVLLDGKAHVFYGHSGAGKSTLSGLALADGHTILSDDLNLVSGGDVPTVRRIPFAGEFRRPPEAAESYQLGGLYQLQKGDSPRTELSRALSFSTLLACAPFVNRDPHRYTLVAQTIDKLLVNSQAGQFYFSRDFVPWNRLAEAC